MASLYKRATPSQTRILRIVEGAVRNAAHAHQGVTVPNTFARSVAKRAAGTLTAGWPEVLAAKLTPSNRSVGRVNGPAAHGGLSLVKSAKRGSPWVSRRSPLDDLWRRCSKMVGVAKRAGDQHTIQALIEVLKLIAAKQARS